MSFSKYQFLIFIKKNESEKCHIFFLGIRYMLLADKRTQKNSGTRHIAYFSSLNLFCKTILRPKNRLYREYKMSHNVTTETKSLYFEENFA